MPPFKLDSAFSPTADQPKAIASLAEGIAAGERAMTLLGATGTGKTMTMAATVEAVQKPTLVLVHNKTLAAQLCNEFRTFFPENAVEYFVSYYDYYQPEAYVASRDLYIEKDSSINEEIDRLRHAATSALFGRRDVLIVASVSAIFGLGSPETYELNTITLVRGGEHDRDELLRKLVSIQYTRNDTALGRGSFRVRGETLEVFPAYEEQAYRVAFFGDEVERIQRFDPLTGELLIDDMEHLGIWPATHYNTREGTMERMVAGIGEELNARTRRAGGRGQAAGVPSAAPAHPVRHGDAARDRLLQRHRELLALHRRAQAGRAALLPARLLPQGLRRLPRRVAPDRAADRRHVRGRPLAQADARRLRLPAAQRAGQPSADVRGVPVDHAADGVRLGHARAQYERTHSERIVEQIVRPTGIIDPHVEVRETRNQIDDLMNEIRTRVDREERTLVTTLTKKMSEDLTDYLLEMGFRVRYLHSEIDTLERIQIIRDLRLGEYDVLVGVNLLREGLDLPEVSLVAILDADKEGFLRGETSLIQTIGRAARNQDGVVIMYADKQTAAMEAALSETDRRRAIQLAYNEEHGITPSTIVKGISDIAEFLQSESKVPSNKRAAAPQEADRRADDRLRPREDDRRARGGDAGGRRRAALRVRGAAARRAARAAPRPRQPEHRRRHRVVAGRGAGPPAALSRRRAWPRRRCAGSAGRPGPG